MKTGKSLTELAQEIERQAAAKKDFVADTRAIHMDEHLQLRLGGADAAPDLPTLPVRKTAHRQIGDRLGIPAKYYDRMMDENPDLLAENVNSWLAKTPERRLVRTLDGSVRAFLSERYRPLDNFDLAQAVLPKLMQGNTEVVSCDVTESKFYIKAIVPAVKVELPPAGVTAFEWGKDHHAIDVLQPGIVISNSEIGMGALAIQPAVHTVQCSNLAIFKQDAMRKAHLGRGAAGDDANEDLVSVFSDKTRELSDQALWAQVSDIVDAALAGELFNRIVERLRAARGQVIEGQPIKAVEVLGNKHGLTEAETEGVLTALLRSGDLSQYGLHAAITRTAANVESYDRATELEQLGATIIELPKKDWQLIAQAA